jgi:hypothetical protein
MANKNPKNIPQIFCCDFCDYNTGSKKDYSKHILTSKHKRLTNTNEKSQKSQNVQKYVCNCGKIYKHMSSLCKHKNICDHNQCDNIIINNEIMTADKDLIMMLVKQNTELLEVLKNGTNNNSNNNNNTNSHNKTFNLQLFLNETCKDAMNIMDFVESIQLQLSDLEKVADCGYVEGISNIITNNLKALDVTQRPIHCTDKKREVLYIKDENKWEKEDEDKKKLRKAIKKVATKNQRLLPIYKEEHPDCVKSTSPFSDQYNKMIIESMGGIGSNDAEKEDKIIKKISNVTTIDKDFYM